MFYFFSFSSRSTLLVLVYLRRFSVYLPRDLFTQSERDPTVLPLTASKSNGEKVTMWAKMDTGANKNLISLCLIHKLGRATDIRDHDRVCMHEIGGRSFNISQAITLDFEAGYLQNRFSSEFFIIGHENIDLPDRPTPDIQNPIPNTDSMTEEQDPTVLPDILLGEPFLRDSHALMTDIEFQNPADPRYEVLVPPPVEGVASVFCVAAGGTSRVLGRGMTSQPASVRPVVKWNLPRG